MNADFMADVLKLLHLEVPLLRAHKLTGWSWSESTQIHSRTFIDKLLVDVEIPVLVSLTYTDRQLSYAKDKMMHAISSADWSDRWLSRG